MIRAMGSAASGMKAQQMNIDTIANNLANVNTTGYKRSHTEFQDLLYEKVMPGGLVNAEGRATPVRVEVGHGVKLVATNKNFDQGTIVATGNPLDVMIEGDGFFQLRMPDGTIKYTRDGSFKMDADRNVVTAEGYRLEPALVIPEDALEVSVSRDGIVSTMVQGDDANVQEIGQLELARFPNAAGLAALGGNVFSQTPGSGQPILGQPGLEGMGATSAGYLEMSNVETVDELVNMITAQRAYELNSKTITMADEMLQIVNRLVR
ncbi:MAG: flagellar basal-body rod protein FlgG [bacterium]|jgi:flagellar basal-body rod protein FlgG|nr:flagellar basal-body rod protein FlgG [bacterium]MBK7045946.1 flagellar basal-body rod protein FlgG [bacterium]MBK7189334.1 flagellar basal-body rod protein FlgG [bacterium]MBK7671579.1 flagellar basal-body rod protein FlgG [bacterium]MBK7770638.1 flagellar basal-body rod protein FlgG [bacterium]